MADTAPAPSPAPVAAPTALANTALFSAAAPVIDAAAPAASDAPPEWMPEKYRVVGADGKLDMLASSQKLADGYTHAAKRIGSGDIPPAKAEDYKVTLPEALKDVALDDALMGEFRTDAHKAGLTQGQYDFVMAKYFDMVPSMLNSAAKVSADEARGELQKVWANTAAYDENMNNAVRAVHSVPIALQSQLEAKFGTDPLFLQFAAALGKTYREDTPAAGNNQAPNTDAQTLMSTEAYRNPKHPQHAQVSAQVQAMFKRRHGE